MNTSAELICVSLFMCLSLLFVEISNANRSHILFILADDLGYNDIGYHNEAIFSPNINQLAAEGLRLENYYVQPICTPSRSQLLTGRYQIRYGLQHSIIWPDQPSCLPLDETILPQELKKFGYHTHAIGKWHLGFFKEACLPTRRGFDSFFGYLTGGEDYYTKATRAGFPGAKKHYHGYDFRDNEKPAYSSNGTYSAYLYRDRAIKIIESHNPEEPMFLYMPFQSVHDPLEVPAKYIERYKHISDKKRRIYSAMVSALDEVVGHVIEALQKHGLWENTLTVFSTDNGGQSLSGGNNWPLRGRKATLWEGGIRGVGVVHGAAVDGGGRVSRELVHISDWFPTLVHAAGGNTTTKALDGRDAWDVIASAGGKSRRSELLHNIDPAYTRPADPYRPRLAPWPNRHGVDTRHGHAALRVGRWKLLTGDPGHELYDPNPNETPSRAESVRQLALEPSVRLYDIEADPRETVDCAESFPYVVDAMLEKLARYNESAVPCFYPAPDPRCDPGLHNGVWGPWE